MTVSLAEDRPVGRFEDRNVVIKDHFCWHPLPVNQHLIQPVLALLEVLVENSLDALRILGECRNGRQEVAVPDVALLDICRYDALLDHFEIRHDLADSLPGDLSFLELEVEGGSAGGEVGVSEGLPCGLALAEVSLVLGGPHHDFADGLPAGVVSHHPLEHLRVVDAH